MLSYLSTGLICGQVRDMRVDEGLEHDQREKCQQGKGVLYGMGWVGWGDGEVGGAVREAWEAGCQPGVVLTRGS